MTTIDNEADLLNTVTLRADLRDVLVQAAKRFERPAVKVEDFDEGYVITITEGAADAKTS